MADPDQPESQRQDLDENQLVAQRRDKLAQLRDSGRAYPNDFRREHLAGDLQRAYGEWPREAFSEQPVSVVVAGRMMAKRIMGKASFTQIQDMSGRIQLYVQRDALAEAAYADFKTWDVGDIVGAEGTLFKTKTGELTVQVGTIRLLTKSLRPLPEKWHGLTDLETRYRMRYVDLIVTPQTRERFKRRTQIIDGIRRYMVERDFIEVETPMMQPIPGGATARPFVTHHNALDMDLFLRIAPELYLKRLLVGGFERVFEINRNFRNEGLSTRHNPEFTMLEFYWAYVDYHALLDFTEGLMRQLAQEVLGTTRVSYQGDTYDLGPPFQRMTVREAILAHNPDMPAADIDDLGRCRARAERLGIPVNDGFGLGKLQLEIFEKTAEPKLIQPTFITEYPIEVSPLSRRKDDDPFVADRFEFFIGGRELANGFSELNDPEDQAERFKRQVAEKDAGDEEAMHFDADYIRALEYGMPPAAGEGIGIDRLVMFLTDAPSIRDVILFPHMRPEHEPG